MKKGLTLVFALLFMATIALGQTKHFLQHLREFEPQFFHSRKSRDQP
jgi:hypothetical protein